MNHKLFKIHFSKYGRDKRAMRRFKQPPLAQGSFGYTKHRAIGRALGCRNIVSRGIGFPMTPRQLAATGMSMRQASCFVIKPARLRQGGLPFFFLFFID